MPTILAVNGDLDEIVRRALAAAGDRGDEVEIETSGLYPGVSLPDDLAREAGFVGDEQGSTDVVSDGPVENPESDSEKTPTPAKAPAKRGSRTPAK